MDKIQALTDRHGLTVMHAAQFSAEVNAGRTELEIHNLQLANHYNQPEEEPVWQDHYEDFDYGYHDQYDF